MNNAAAISAVNCALAHSRRQADAPTDQSTREIIQMSMLTEYLHETHRPELARQQNDRPNSPAYDQTDLPAVA